MFSRLRRGIGVWLTVCCLSVGLPTLPTARAVVDEGRVNRALLIGVDDFVSHPSIYPSSTNNVFAMQEALQGSGVPFETIMIPQSPVTSPKTLSKLIHQTFGAADEDDASYLYICTHGEYDGLSESEPVLLLSDGVSEGRLTPRALQSAFDGIKGAKVLVLDACYSGAFIGKGMRAQPQKLYFLGSDYKVIASSGAMEESWYWNTARSEKAAQSGGFPQGAFYFTQALSQSMSARYGYPADANRDGDITLRELYAAMLKNHAASTPQVYPQEDDFVIFHYDVAQSGDTTQTGDDRSPIGDVTFASNTLGVEDNTLNLEFIALRPVRVAYQIVQRRDGQWRFDEAQLVYDTVEQFTAYGDERGAIIPGRKVRTLSLDFQGGDAGGYVLVQLVSIDGEKLTVHAGRVIAIAPSQGDLALGIEVADAYTTNDPRELSVFVKHAYPCELSVAIVNSQGKTVRRLCHRQSTRPLKITPEGSTFYWDGRDKQGAPVAPGKYRVQASGYMGELTFSAESPWIAVHESKP